MKAFEHTVTTLGSFRRALDPGVLETGLHLETSPRLETDLLSKETLGPRQMEKRTPLMLLTGALVLRVTETEAQCTIEAVALLEMDSKIPPALSTEARVLRVMETGARPKEAPGHLKATASSMMTFQSRYHILAPQANGCMVSTPL